MTTSFRLSCLATCCLLFLSQPAWAQLHNPGQQVGAVPLNDLKAALPFVNWNSRTRGPLIAITPEEVRWERDYAVHHTHTKGNDQSKDAAQQPLYAPGEGEKDTLDADQVARHFLHKLIRLPTLSIFAPPQMIVINTRLHPANPLMGAKETSEVMRRLEATLTASQWQMIGSPTGLGKSDLTREQQTLFDATLPETMTIARESVHDLGNGYVRAEVITNSERTLTLKQRQGTRLHLERKARFDLLVENNRSTSLDNPFHDTQAGVEKTVLLSTVDAPEARGTLFGQTISQRTPNRLKPSDLNLKQRSLREAWVPLIGVKTVGDLLQATQKATGLELRADDRLARLSVYVSAEDCPVRASDLLTALCWSLTSTYRKVGPVPGGEPNDFAYVLTHDRSGLAAERGLIEEWYSQGVAQRKANDDKIDTAIRESKSARYIDYAADGLLLPTPDARLALHEAQEDEKDQRDSGDNGTPPTIPSSTLTDEQRRQMRNGLQQIDEINRKNAGLGNGFTPLMGHADRVFMYNIITAAYIVPGVGEVCSDRAWWDDALAPEFPPDSATRVAVRASNRSKIQDKLTSSLRDVSQRLMEKTVVCMAPATVEEVEPMFAAASSLGVGEVWINVTSDDKTSAGCKLLAECVAAGAVHGVKVGAQVSLIQRSPENARRKHTNTNAMEDLNVFGETGAQWAVHFARMTEGIDMRPFFPPDRYGDGRDLLAAEAPAAQTFLTERLRAITAVPGLSTLALRDAAAPGRDWSQRKPDYSSWIGSGFGYTVADRLAFLRQSGYDPIDLASRSVDYQVMNVTRLSRFAYDNDESGPDYYNDEIDISKILGQWDEFRARTERDFLRCTRANLQKMRPDTAVYLASYDLDMPTWSVREYQRWGDADTLPFSPESYTSRIFHDSLHYFPLGKVFAPLIQEGIPAQTIFHAPTYPNLFDRAALYILHTLPGGGQRPVYALPATVLDMTGIKTADAMTFLRGTLQTLIGKK